MSGWRRGSLWTSWLGAAALPLLLWPGPSEAQQSWTEALADGGLAAAEQALASGPQTPETAFTLGGVRFLQSIETILQTRHATYVDQLPFIPGMAVELPASPNAQFDPAFVETAMTGALSHLAGAEAALAVAVEGEFAVEVQLKDLWFDVDANGQRAKGEGLFELAGEAIGAPDQTFDGVVRFDSADADWLKAYVHLLSGTAELVLSVDPTPAIRTVTDGRAALEQFGPLNEMGLPGETFIETIASVLVALRGEPDAARTRAAHDHFRAMIAHNRAFWTKVALETDDDREWLPNAQQSSAFGIAVDADLAAGWSDVLDEIEALIEGETLIPYWRVTTRGASGEQGVGINLAKLLQDPPDMDLVLWIQGAAAAPYLERGRIADFDAWRRFEGRVFGGEGFIFAAWFN